MHPALASGRQRTLHAAAWALAAGMLSLLVRATAGASWPAALAFGVPIGALLGPVSLSAWYICRATPLGTVRPTRLFATVLGAAAAAGSVWAAMGLVWAGILEIGGLRVAMAPAGLPALLAGFGGLSYLLAITVYYAGEAVAESAAAERRALELEIGERDAELRALRAQVDPHFLFNSLNAVAGLAPVDGERARRMCLRLAEFLRESLSVGGTAAIPLARETALTERYLDVERVRFGDRLQVRTMVDDGSAAVPVPPLILQPLVENAVRHGVAGCLDGGCIEVSAARAGAWIRITVTNPRDPDAPARGTGFGQDLVRRRLAAMYGDRAVFAVESLPDCYRASITVPAPTRPLLEQPS